MSEKELGFTLEEEEGISTFAKEDPGTGSVGCVGSVGSVGDVSCTNGK